MNIAKPLIFAVICYALAGKRSTVEHGIVLLAIVLFSYRLRDLLPGKIIITTVTATNTHNHHGTLKKNIIAPLNILSNKELRITFRSTDFNSLLLYSLLHTLIGEFA